jgi:hypothetical protein
VALPSFHSLTRLYIAFGAHTYNNRLCAVPSLKSRNKIALATMLGLNLSLYAALLYGSDIPQLFRRPELQDIRALVTASVAILLTGLLNAQVSGLAKARVVFWRWTDPLPGCRAFSHIMHVDPRIDVHRLATRHGPLPMDPAAQNVLWYRLYQRVADRSSVIDAHREYLFARDYATLVALVFFVVIPLSVWTMRGPLPVIIMAVALLGQYLIAVRAARVHGTRFVSAVLAIHSSEEGA